MLLTFSISLNPPYLRPKVLQIGVGQTQVLVGTRHSPLSGASVTVAETLAELADSSAVEEPVARSVGANPSEIGVDEQLLLNVPLAVSDSREQQVGAQILASHQPYHVLVRNDQGSAVVQIFTQAPTARAAIRMANAAAQGLVQFAQRSRRVGSVTTPVEAQQLAPATGGIVDRNASQDAAALLAIAFWLLGMTALLTLQRLARLSGRRHLGRGLGAGRSQAGEAMP